MPMDQQDIVSATSMLLQNGVKPEELPNVMQMYEQEKAYQESKAGGPPTFIKAMLASTPSTVADTIRGLGFLFSGEADSQLGKLAAPIESLTPKMYERQAAEAAAGPLMGAGAGETWQAVLGGMTPLLAELALTRGAGGGLAKIMGAGTKAAGIAGEVAAAGSMVGVETGSYIKAAEQAGVDPDIIEQNALTAGALNGLVEYAQGALALGPFKKIDGPGWKKLLGYINTNKAAKFALQEVGASSAEGIEELVQGNITHTVLNNAVSKMKERYGADWAPAYEIPEPDDLRAFVTGAVGGEAARGAGFATQFGQALYQSAKELKTYQDNLARLSRNEVMNPNPTKLVDEDKRIQLDNRPTGYEDFQKTGTALSDAQKLEMLGTLARNNRAKFVQSASNMGVKVTDEKGKLRKMEDILTDVKPKIKDLNEGVTEKGGVITLNPINVDAIDSVDELHGRALTKVTGNVVNNMAKADMTVTDDDGTKVPINTSYGGKLKRFQIFRDALIESGLSEKAAVDERINPKPNKPVDPRPNIPTTLHSVVFEDGRTLDQQQQQQTPFAFLSQNNAKLLDSMIKKYEDIRVRIDSDNRIHLMSGDAPIKYKGKDIVWKQVKPSLDSRVVRIHPQQGVWGRATVEIMPTIKQINKASQEKQDEIIYSELRREKRPAPIPLTAAMTRRQYHLFLNKLYHQVYQLNRTEFDQRAANSFTVSAFAGLPPINMSIKTEDLTNIPKSITAVRILRPFQWIFNDLGNKMSQRFIGFDAAIQQAKSIMIKAHHMVNSANMVHWSKVPREFIKGNGRRMINDIAYLVGGNAEQSQYISNQYNLGISTMTNKGKQEAAKRLIDEYMQKMKLPPERRTDVMKAIDDTAANMRGIYDWWANQGAISPEMYIKHYIPMVRKFYNDKNEAIDFGEYIESNRPRLKKEQGLQDFEVDKMKKFASLVFDLNRKGMTIPGEKTPFMQFHREKASAEIKEMALETDLDSLMSRYNMQAARYIAFNSLAPSIDGFINEIAGQLIRDDKRQYVDSIRNLFSEYLNSIYGVPTEGSKFLSDTKLTEVPLTGALYKSAVDWYNNSFSERFNLKKVPDITVKQFVDTITLGTYLNFLGPFNLVAGKFNWLSPIKNIITQLPLATILGPQTFFQGLRELQDEKRLKELFDMDLRMEIPIPEFNAMSGGGMFKKFAETLLTMYTISDRVTVYAAASAALTAWKRVETVLSKDPKLDKMTREQLTKLLFKGADPAKLGLDKMGDVTFTDRYGKPKPTVGTWNKVKDIIKGTESPEAMRGLVGWIYEELRKGNSEQAKDHFVRYVMQLTNWRYGEGGTPHFLRDGMIRPFFLFLSWPLNYLEYNNMMLNPKNGMMRNAIASLIMQFTLLSIFAAMGNNTYKWMLMGAMPAEVGPMGPIADLINGIWSTVKTGGEAAMAQALPINAEEQQRTMQIFENKLNALLPGPMKE